MSARQHTRAMSVTIANAKRAGSSLLSWVAYIGGAIAKAKVDGSREEHGLFSRLPIPPRTFLSSFGQLFDIAVDADIQGCSSCNAIPYCPGVK